MDSVRLLHGLLFVTFVLVQTAAAQEQDAARAAQRHVLPMVVSAAEGRRHGLVRIANLEERDATVAIRARDVCGVGSEQLAESVVVNHRGQPGLDALGTDAYQLRAAAIHDDTLVATVSHAGGCKVHAFTLAVADTFRETDPVRLQAHLAHNGNGDRCEAWLSKALRFDLGPVKALYQQAYGQDQGTIVLVLENAPSGELTYQF